MKRKVLIFMVSVFMFVAVMGCSNNQNATDGTSNKDNESTNADSEQNGETNQEDNEITEIIWQYPSPGNLGSGFQDVEDAINSKMEKDIGVRVRFEPVGLMESQNEAVLMAASGEQLDVCLTAFTSMAPLVDGGLIHPLDDLLDNHGQDLLDMLGPNINLGSYDSQIYGIPPADRVGDAYGYLARTDLLEKYNIEIDPNKNYSIEDIENIFEIVKEGEGDNFYCTIPWNTEADPLNKSYIEYDKLGGSLAAGVLMLNRSFEDLTVNNLFDTEEYERFAAEMYDWAQKGYISPDAAVTTEFPDALIQSGNYLGTFYWALPTSAADYSATIGKDMTLIPMLDGFVVNGGGGAILWSIPITSANPEKAMEAINYLYNDKEANWLIQFGIEGESYEVVEETEEGTLIRYLSEDTTALPYHNPYGLWGNILEWPVLEPAPIDKNAKIREWMAEIPESRVSPAMGYNFIQSELNTEIAAVSTVIDQYTPSFNSGALDPEKSLPEFREALKAAGIDKIIEENQRQLDVWAQEQ